MQRQQNVSEPVPPFFIRTIVNLENSINQAAAKDKESKKKMNASNARALTAVKQKVKKLLKEFEKEVKRFQEVCCGPEISLGGVDVERMRRILKRLSANIRHPFSRRLHLRRRGLRR